jgi:hypothetical protein
MLCCYDTEIQRLFQRNGEVSLREATLFIERLPQHGPIVFADAKFFLRADVETWRLFLLCTGTVVFSLQDSNT